MTRSPGNPAKYLSHPLAVLMLFLLVGAVIYANTLRVPFVFDDQRFILRNPLIQIQELNPASLLNASQSLKQDRPLVMISFALNYYFGGFNPAGYHIVNIFIHVFTGFFLYCFILRVLNHLQAMTEPTANTGEGLSRPPALAASLLWFVNPVQTQSVTYISQRMTSLVALFFVLCLLCYMIGREKPGLRKRLPWFLAGGLSGLSAMGCKETSAMLPFFILLIEWVIFQDCRAAWLRRKAWLLIPAALPGLYFFFAAVPTENPYNPNANFQNWDFFPVERLLTECRVVVYYFSLLIFPHPSRLNLDYDFPMSVSLLDPLTTLFALAAIVIVIGIALIRLKKNRLFFLAMAWFFGNLIIESTIIPLDIIFEHRIYLPSMLVFPLLLVFFSRLLRNQKLQVLAVCLVIALFSFWTYQRNQVWQNPVSLWSDNVAKSPNKARPRINLGLAYAEQGQTEKAMAEYRAAIRINPKYAEAHNNLGNLLAQQKKYREALKHFGLASRALPEYTEPLINAGYIYLTHGMPEKAISLYREAIKRAPTNYRAYYNLGNVLLLNRKYEQAITQYRAAIRQNPGFANAYNNLGLALESKGKVHEAVKHYYRALQLAPRHADARSNLKALLKRSGSLERGILEYAESMGFLPEDQEAAQRLIETLTAP